MIAKRRAATSQHRRSPDWLKMKGEASQELVVGAFTDPQGQRRGLDALLVGYFEGAELVFAGKVGTGSTCGACLELRAQLDAIELHTRDRAAPARRALGEARARGAGGIHGVDGARQAAPSAPGRRAFRRRAARTPCSPCATCSRNWVCDVGENAGSKGYHIVVPLDGQAGFDTV